MRAKCKFCGKRPHISKYYINNNDEEMLTVAGYKTEKEAMEQLIDFGCDENIKIEKVFIDDISHESPDDIGEEAYKHKLEPVECWVVID